MKFCNEEPLGGGRLKQSANVTASTQFCRIETTIEVFFFDAGCSKVRLA